MICFMVPYEDMYGLHERTVWAGDTKEARDLVRKLKPTAKVGVPQPVDPQPFTDEAREQHSARWNNQKPRP